MLLKILDAICTVMLALAAAGAIAWAWRNRKGPKQRRQAEQAGIGPGEEPSVAERATHLPRDEQSLMGLALGPDQARIAELFRNGELARGAFLELGSVETPISPSQTRITLFSRYGWYDRAGTFHERNTDDPGSGLLNSKFEPVQGQGFLVAFDPQSRDHVVFYAAANRQPAPPRPPAPAPDARPPERELPAIAQASPEELVRLIGDRWEDPGALAVIADRLQELGDARGEVLTLSLARAPGQPPGAREQELLARHQRDWVPPGVRCKAFERAMPVHVVWLTSTQVRHPGWAAVQTIECEAHPSTLGSPFDIDLPRLRVVRDLKGLLTPQQWARCAKRLELLELHELDALSLRAMCRALPEMTHLRRFEVQVSYVAADGVVSMLAEKPPPRLECVQLPSTQLNGGVLDAIVATLLRAGATWAVELLLPFHSPERRTWIRATQQGLSVHTRGAPNGREIVAARSLAGPSAPVFEE